jgi:hypothetical protein
MMLSLNLSPVPPIYGGDRDPRCCSYTQIAYVLAPGPDGRDPLDRAKVSDAQDIHAELLVHDSTRRYFLAPWRNAAMAAGLLRRQSTLWTRESNHTNPSNP